jgi:hypothetical protein
MHTDFPVPDEAVEHRVATEGLDDVDELHGVLAAMVAHRAVEGELLLVARVLADALPEVDLFSGLSAHSPLGAFALAHFVTLS